jgi:NADH-quinone oxidoreductase subunit E
MATKSAAAMDETGAADATAAFGRLAADMLQNAQSLPLHPLMAHPVAAMAAATAVGFGFSTQMAGAFLGALQGAVEATNKFAAALERDSYDAVSPVSPAAISEPMKPQRQPRAAATTKTAPTKAKAAGGTKAPAIEIAAKSVARRPRAAKAEDLKLISGIGPKLETVLNERGIARFADIAGWTEADIARIDAELGFDGRILRDDWVSQAKALSGPARGGK